MAEWRDVVDAWQITTWEDYRDVQRLGRKNAARRIKQREVLWWIFEQVQCQLAETQGLSPGPGCSHALPTHYRSGQSRSPSTSRWWMRRST